MNARLDIDEVRLEAGWDCRPDGSLRPDSVWQRIDWLVAEILVRVGATDDGWTVLFEDPHDGRRWELSYPNSAAHGGGAPVLQVIDSEVAARRYGEKFAMHR